MGTRVNREPEQRVASKAAYRARLTPEQRRRNSARDRAYRDALQATARAHPATFTRFYEGSLAAEMEALDAAS